jgi:hypothetical protein
VNVAYALEDLIATSFTNIVGGNCSPHFTEGAEEVLGEIYFIGGYCL